MAYDAKVLCDSVSPDNVRLTTMEVTLPRIILSEFNTHRMFSRNSASSRAIPVEKMLKKVQDDPFIPVYWGKNQKGMQAEQELTAQQQGDALAAWLIARDSAVQHAHRLLDLGIHKQITNRLLEPFLWHTIVVTATEWDNFWGLRCNPMAQPEIRRAADMLRSAYTASTPNLVPASGWHLPLVPDKHDLVSGGYGMDDVCKISVARCARVSYLTHDGKREPQADIELYDRLASSGHLSPMEHCARPMSVEDAQDIVLGQMSGCGSVPPDITPSNVFCANFRGWVQLRRALPFESNFLARLEQS